MNFKAILFGFTLLSLSCKPVIDIKFEDEKRPVFFVDLYKDSLVRVFVSESFPLSETQVPVTDTANLSLELFHQGTFIEKLSPKALSSSDFLTGDTLTNIFYYSASKIETDTDYSVKLKYKNYDELILTDKIYTPDLIDSFQIIPHIFYLRGAYNHICKFQYINNQATNKHHFAQIKIVYSDTSYIDYNYLTGEKLITEEPAGNVTNSVEFGFRSNPNYGKFKAILYLYTINEGFYQELFLEKLLDEYYYSKTVFDPIPSFNHYTQLQNAFANIRTISCDIDSSVIIEPYPTVNK